MPTVGASDGGYFYLVMFTHFSSFFFALFEPAARWLSESPEAHAFCRHLP
jgi:hypothetical protein